MKVFSPCKSTRPEAPPLVKFAADFGIIEASQGANLPVTVRAIGQQYSFTPQCIVVPADTPITLRATSADVVHGLLIEGTNINTMLVPGYVAEALALANGAFAEAQAALP